MGTEVGFEDERPPHPVFVDAFELAVCPVTRAEYECFVDATAPELPRDWSHPLFAQADLPVVGVSWARRGRVLRVAIRAGRGARPVADRSRVGIRRPRADSRRSSHGVTRCRRGFRTADAGRSRRHGR